MEKWDYAETKNSQARQIMVESSKQSQGYLIPLQGLQRASLVARFSRLQLPVQESRVPSLNQEDALEKETATLSYSCLGNSMDRGAWWATVHGVAKSQIQLSNQTATPGLWVTSWAISLSYFATFSKRPSLTTQPRAAPTPPSRRTTPSLFLLHRALPATQGFRDHHLCPLTSMSALSHLDHHGKP